MRKLFLLLLLCALLFPVAAFGASFMQQPQTPASTQTPKPPTVSPCADSAFQNFDFWVGTWIVRDQKGNEIGRSEITKVAAGCAVLESWKDGNGVPGTSLNYFDKKSGKWNQHWVGGNGEALHLSGTREGRKMILSGLRMMPKGQQLDRIVWTLLTDGRVQQEWSISTDGGQNWQKSFDGFYSRQ